MNKRTTPANSQRHPLSPAERAAKLLAFKPVSRFNSPIYPKTEPGDSALARAKAGI